MASTHHDRSGPVPVRIAFLTVSDTRGPSTDLSGQVARRLITAAGHSVLDYRIAPDEPEQIRSVVVEWLEREDCDAVVVSGGTGISPRDRTVEALAALVEQRLDGFSEIFRMLSYEQVGSAAMLSRTLGGVAHAKPLFALPGSPQAVELALERLILPELGHILAELRKGEGR